MHTITSDGALGFAGPLEHVAAAASEFSGHSDLLVTSAAKETEYMLKTAAASVAAVVDHVLNTLLFESEAFACGYTFCSKSVSLHGVPERQANAAGSRNGSRVFV